MCIQFLVAHRTRAGLHHGTEGRHCPPSHLNIPTPLNKTITLHTSNKYISNCVIHILFMAYRCMGRCTALYTHTIFYTHTSWLLQSLITCCQHSLYNAAGICAALFLPRSTE
ncbi:hypothetical protein FKM82_029785 [Ascaphus truei]